MINLTHDEDAHEDVGGVQAALHEPPLRLGEVDAAEGRLGQVVVRHEGDAVQAHLLTGGLIDKSILRESRGRGRGSISTPAAPHSPSS